MARIDRVRGRSGLLAIAVLVAGCVLLLQPFGFNQGAYATSFQYTSVASYSLVNAFEKQGESFEWKMHTFPAGPKDQQHFSQKRPRSSKKN